MSPRRFVELSRPERRRAALITAGRCVLMITAVLGLYYVFPTGGKWGDTAALVRLGIGAVVFIAVMIYTVRQIVRSELPELRAIEAFALVFPLFLVLFAGFYVALSEADAASFTEELNKPGALYFVVVTFATVGFGDITPVSDLARSLVTVQVIMDLGFIAVVIRILFQAANLTLTRGRPGEPKSAQPDSRDAGQ